MLILNLFTGRGRRTPSSLKEKKPSNQSNSLGVKGHLAKRGTGVCLQVQAKQVAALEHWAAGGGVLPPPPIRLKSCEGLPQQHSQLAQHTQQQTPGLPARGVLQRQTAVPRLGRAKRKPPCSGGNSAEDTGWEVRQSGLFYRGPSWRDVVYVMPMSSFQY